ncbi:MAG: hypothetical protein QNJ72_40550 [Pleurocapsa sp. MO_226.B13]|nr:hypothetical protein [Pleurocapsa sp. MO_226.B13]
MNSTAISNNKTVERWFAFILTVWAGIVFLAGYYDLFTKLPLPSVGILATLGITLPVLLYYRHAAFQNYIRSLDPVHLTLFHLWRILAGFTFLDYGSHNLLPEQFVINAGYGDLAVGFAVPIVLIWKPSKYKYIAFHIFSLLDFIVAVGTGIAFTVLQVPLMENIATFPLVLIPLYGVCITGALSWMAIDTLLRR